MTNRKTPKERGLSIGKHLKVSPRFLRKSHFRKVQISLITRAPQFVGFQAPALSLVIRIGDEEDRQCSPRAKLFGPRFLSESQVFCILCCLMGCIGKILTMVPMPMGTQRCGLRTNISFPIPLLPGRVWLMQERVHGGEEW